MSQFVYFGLAPIDSSAVSSIVPHLNPVCEDKWGWPSVVAAQLVVWQPADTMMDADECLKTSRGNQSRPQKSWLHFPAFWLTF